jgi:hypothetical protein
MFLHAVVCLCIDDGEEIGFDSKLNFLSQFIPDIGIGGGTIVGEAESKLRS